MTFSRPLRFHDYCVFTTTAFSRPLRFHDHCVFTTTAFSRPLRFHDYCVFTTTAFSRLLRFGCVLEETHGTTYLEVVREVLKEGQEFEVNVIELYVIQS